VDAQQALISLGCLGPEVRTFSDPRCTVVSEQDVTRVGIEPVAVEDLGFLTGEPDLSVSLALEGVGCRAVDSVRARVTGLVAAGWKTAILPKRRRLLLFAIGHHPQMPPTTTARATRPHGWLDRHRGVDLEVGPDGFGGYTDVPADIAANQLTGVDEPVHKPEFDPEPFGYLGNGQQIIVDVLVSCHRDRPSVPGGRDAAE
jgi:hypothetical protein